MPEDLPRGSIQPVISTSDEPGTINGEQFVEVMGEMVDIRSIKNPILRRIIKKRCMSSSTFKEWDEHDRYSRHNEYNDEHSRAWYSDDCSP